MHECIPYNALSAEVDSGPLLTGVAHWSSSRLSGPTALVLMQDGRGSTLLVTRRSASHHITITVPLLIGHIVACGAGMCAQERCPK